MLTKWTGFSSEEERYTDSLKLSLLGEEPLEMLAEVQPAVDSRGKALVVEVPAEKASLVIRDHMDKRPEAIADEIRVKLEMIRDERQRKHLTKGYDWW
ncbi:MAG TPA: hypothetical protein DEA96_06990 [Leptospiraceae bacterium]|nr:hypothetical protein [Spirochaetaceae bacterium]HBS04690.1 hypothetical protein [Leptospiraceae bacterium]|tara:strand:+ start:32196 stop:32489 length:294 start_codon:yes stop_codon:yes gene_type:complete